MTSVRDQIPLSCSWPRNVLQFVTPVSDPHIQTLGLRESEGEDRNFLPLGVWKTLLLLRIKLRAITWVGTNEEKGISARKGSKASCGLETL